VTTNLGVGSSNLSGRANKINELGLCALCVASQKTRLGSAWEAKAGFFVRFAVTFALLTISAAHLAHCVVAFRCGNCATRTEKPLVRIASATALTTWCLSPRGN
jgi:hypothetical protein